MLLFSNITTIFKSGKISKRKKRKQFFKNIFLNQFSKMIKKIEKILSKHKETTKKINIKK